MKHSILSTSIVLCLLTSACQKEFEETQSSIQGGKLFLYTESFAPDDMRKISVNDTLVQWDGGENVYLNGSSYSVIIENNKAYIKANELLNTPIIYGYCPASILHNEGNTTNPTITIPSKYESSFNGDKQSIDLPMTAYRTETGNSLQFKHLTAAVKIQVWNATSKKIFIDSVSVHTAHYRINGRITINLENDSLITWDNADVPEGNRKVQVSFPIPVPIESGSNTTYIQVPILPIGEDDMTIFIYSHSSDIEGVPINNLTHIFSHTTSNPILGRNILMSAKIKIDPSSTHVTSRGTFSVSDTKSIYFSKGNLFCHKYVDTWSSSTCNWSFFENQYETFEYNGQNIGTDYSNVDTISLFSWGTSNLFEEEGRIASPFITTGVFDYGPGGNNFTLNGIYDWGFNAITNGGNTQNSGWRTLTIDEWSYLLDGARGNGTRTTYTYNLPNGTGDNLHARWIRATINGQYKGLIIFPDTYYHPEGVTLEGVVYNSTGRDNFQTIIATISDWRKMEAAGAVFLPAAGSRLRDDVRNVSTEGIYWNSFSYGPNASIRNLVINRYAIGTNGSDAGYMGHSVRLVRDAN